MRLISGISLLLLASAPAIAQAQKTATAPAARITAADYQRAATLKDRVNGLVTDVADAPTWTSNASFWYRKSARGDSQVTVVVDVTTLSKRMASAGEAAAPAGRGTAGQGAPGGRGTGARGPNTTGRLSPDGKLLVTVINNNIAWWPTGSDVIHFLSTDGTPDHPYVENSIVWSPDSKKLVANRVTPGDRRMVRYVQSSPTDQLQPKTFERFYAKPGDKLDIPHPTLFDIDANRAIAIDTTLFANPYDMSRMTWRRDSRAFTFEYNQRGHQVLRVIEVNAATGMARAIVTDSSATFIDYRRTNGSLTDSGREFRYDLGDGDEMIWISEKDGWAHLYLYDARTGALKNQITHGDWLVRNVVRVDEAARQIIFVAGGMNPKQDPYFSQYYRINFDGTGLTALTDADGTHTVTFSPDYAYYVDSWTRVDLPPVSQLRRTSDQKVLLDLEKGDATALLKTGWKPPEVFVAKARDGKTDVWGVIYRPTNFNPARKYPVIENIYAGPHGSFVPKSWATFHTMRALAELGFIVVQIDGMGTANRSKAFHDVAWKNLADAGFADRILWHKAVAARYPSYDITRVGIYGGSAGGQNTLGGLLFHPEFYDAGVAFAGSHDNRMDKIWWNELWMSWPIGPQYAASSNVDNAYRLQGKLMLVFGELDTNVDPSSSMQVVNALIKANKNFDLLVMPGEDHDAGRRGPSAPYGDRKMWDFFIRNLQGVEPPNWNAPVAPARR